MVILDLSLEIVARAERLGRALHPATATQLARTVRIMITHYSNLIEGHNTRPREIKQALQGIRLEDDRRDLYRTSRGYTDRGVFHQPLHRHDNGTAAILSPNGRIFSPS